MICVNLRHAEAARNYTHLQAVRRVGAMRSLQRPTIPQDMHALAEILNNPQYPAYSQTLQIPPTRFFQQEVIINGRSVGVVFANRVAIEQYREDLNTVTMVGIDETFKTVPSHPTDLKCLLTFQVVFNSVVSIDSHCCQHIILILFFFFFRHFLWFMYFWGV